VSTTLAELQQQRAKRIDPLDLPRTMTQREVNAYVEATEALDRRIPAVRNASSTLAELGSSAADQQWVSFLTRARQTLCDEILALPPRPRTDYARGMLQNLTLSITAIDRGSGVIRGTGYALETLRLGALIKEAGYVAAPAIDGQIFGKLPWLGSMHETERRIASHEKRRADAQAQLDEALLDDVARETLTGDRAAYAAERNARPTRKTRGDGSQYDKYPDGRIVEIEITG
jgi:hypothetical protein